MWAAGDAGGVYAGCVTLDHRTDLRLSRAGTLGAAGTASVGLVALGAAAVLTPKGVSSGPSMCPFAIMTGLPCPGCGLTRSWVAFMHGDIGTAFTLNIFGPVLLLATALTTLIAAVTLIRRRRDPLIRWRDLVIGPLGAVLLGTWLLYGLVRLVDAAAGWGLFPIIV